MSRASDKSPVRSRFSNNNFKKNIKIYANARWPSECLGQTLPNSRPSIAITDYFGGHSMNTRLLQHLATKGLIGLTLAFCLAAIAQAIPPNQRDVDTTSTGDLTNTADAIVSNTSVTVNNGNNQRQCIIQFSSEVSTTEVGDGVRVHYTVDSTNPNSCVAIGPEDFYVSSAGNNTLDTRTAIGARQIGQGTHTVRVCAALRDLNNNNTGTYQLFFRTLTVECRTQ